VVQKSDQASNNGHIQEVKTSENYKNDVPKETCQRHLYGVGYLQEVPVSYRVILVLWTWHVKRVVSNSPEPSCSKLG